MNRFIYITIALLFFYPSIAQQYYMRGEVRDEAGNPLQNVSIRLASTGYLYFTGATGSFGIVTTRQVDTLTFHMDGYKQEIGVPTANGYIYITLKKLSGNQSAHGYKLASLTKDLKRETQQGWFAGDETYASIVENGFVPAGQYPSTGITLNIDRASYSNIRRFITTGMQVPPDAVRMEEMLNYFNINYSEPDSNKTFGIETALTNCPWNAQSQLLFANIRSKKLLLDSLPPSNLVFLIDVSASMDMPNRLPMLKSGFRALVNNLRSKDSVAVVVYGGATAIMLHPTSGAEKEKILKVIDSLTASGATPGESGVKLAYNVAKLHFIKGGNNRVILATDGDFNVGLKTESELEDLITAQKESGIYLTCLGVGMGNYKDSKIQTLAQKGNGNFAYIDSYAEADKVLMKEFMQTLYTVADDAFINVKFDKSIVKDYRLIGFDNKAGAIKDTSTALEGGEIGSAYSIQVVFEITPVAGLDLAQPLKPAQFLLQYKQPSKKEVFEMSFAPQVTYQPLDSLNKSYQFASAVIMFGSMLRNSSYTKTANWNQLIELSAKSIEKENLLHQEFLSLVQQAKVLYTKKKKRKD